MTLSLIYNGNETFTKTSHSILRFTVLHFRAVSGLKQDLAIRDDLLAKAHRDLEAARGQGVAKVDRYLVKNLVVGYATADAAKKPEVMKILATVLDFNQEERDKAGINTSGQGWLKGWFGGSVGSQGKNI